MAIFGPRDRQLPARPGDEEQRGLSASAQRLPLANKKLLKQMATKKQEWQDESWGYFDDVPEVKAVTWLGGNVMSKLRLYVAVRPLDDPEGDPIPASDPESGIPIQLALRAEAELERLKSPLGGRPEIIRAFSMNLEIAAECYLHMKGPRAVTVDNPDGSSETQLYDEQWNVRSVDEVEVTGDEVKIHQRPNDPGEVLDKTADSIIRIWQRHPRWSYLPDCNMRGVLSECEALVLLSNQVKAVAKSAASAGFLTLPNELGYNVVKIVTDGEDEIEEDPFLDMMNEQLTAPIENPMSAASVSPGIIRGEAQYLDPKYLRHITLDRKADDTLDKRIEERVMRLARGLNYPVETVMGHMNTTFANAQQIDVDKFRDHYEPKCLLLVDCLTVGMLQPNLLDAGEASELVQRLIVWYDPAAIIRSVDPLESADLGYINGIISDSAWRRVRGWTEDDAPEPAERLVRAVLRLRSFDPGLSTAIMELLGVPLDIPAVVPAGKTVGDPNAPPIDDPGNDVPSPPGEDSNNDDGGDSGDNAAQSVQSVQSVQKMNMEQALIALVVAAREGKPVSLAARAAIEPALAAGGFKAALAAHNNPGRQLADIDRNLRAKLAVSADRALTRALERAGNRLKSNADARIRSIVRTTHPVYAAQTLGPKLVASAGFSEHDLIGDDAWSSLEGQFMEWGAGAQSKAINIVNKIVGLTGAERADLQVRQAGSLSEAWTWMQDSLHELAVRRLYEPDPHAPDLGEFDPTSKVPTGLIRQALTRAGGASGLTVQGDSPYVVLDNGQPPGGIATGELVMGALTDGGSGVEGYEWVYGPAYRLHPFEEHEALDGEQFVNFDDDVLSAGDWVGDFYFPGDHDGCNCDFIPVIIDDSQGVSTNEATGEVTQTDGG